VSAAALPLRSQPALPSEQLDGAVEVHGVDLNLQPLADRLGTQTAGGATERETTTAYRTDSELPAPVIRCRSCPYRVCPLTSATSSSPARVHHVGELDAGLEVDD